LSIKLDKITDRAADLATEFVDWAKGGISSMFSKVVDPIVDGLKDWADKKGIKTKMNNFFTKLSDWDDGNGDVDATMEAGTGLMMSFMGQQDKAKQVTDIHSRVPSSIDYSNSIHLIVQDNQTNLEKSS